MNTPKLCKICGQRPVRIENRKGHFYQKTDCNNCHQKNTRKRNPETYRKINQRTRQRCQQKNKTWLDDYLQTKVCISCGESDLRVLNFHHREPSKKSWCISNGIKSHSLSRLQEEVDKCDILCANCHLIHHATNPKGYNWIKKNKILDALNTRQCSRCQNNDIKVLVFHHIDPAQKTFSICKNWSCLDIDALIVEAKKCQVLCQNCHRKLHNQQIE